MTILLITLLLLNRKIVVLNKALIGVISAFVFLFIQAMISSVNTKAVYEFSSNNIMDNVLKITLNDGHASIITNSKCNNQKSFYASHFNGLYLRIQNHYYLFGIENMGKNNSQLMFSDFFIDSLRSGEAIYISRSPTFCGVSNKAPKVLLGKRIFDKG